MVGIVDDLMLTLTSSLDLPGLTRVPIAGQDPNIQQTITQMIMKYIAPQEIIILVRIYVSPVDNLWRRRS